MKINEVAKLTGVTVRTLHYYDEIGLLRPSEVTNTGYRLYDEDALETLQQILFFRELEFSLNEIKDIITNPSFDKAEALLKHKKLLLKKRERLNGLIELVNETLQGEKRMSFKEFDITEIEKYKKEYAEETKARWGGTDAYLESERKCKHYGKEQWQRINMESENILKAFTDNLDKAPDSDVVQGLVKEWQEHITNHFYNCTNEILSGLGVMYVSDERFKKNMDKYGIGTTEFIAKAIEIYCKK